MITVYIEEIFLINFISNYIFFYISLKFINERIDGKKLVFSSLIWGIYCVLSFKYPVLFNIFFKNIFLLFNVYFFLKLKKKLLKFFIVFLFINFTVIGFISFISLIFRVNIKSSNGFLMFSCIPFAIPVYFISLVIIFKLICIFFKMKKNQSNIYECILNINGEELKFKGFIDSGNFLKNFSGKEIAVFDKDKFKCSFYDELKNINGIEEFTQAKKHSILNDKINFIYFSTAGKSNNFALTIAADEIIIKQGETEKIIDKPIIALGKVKEKNFDCLLPEKWIN